MKTVRGYHAEVLLFQVVRNHVAQAGEKLGKSEMEIDTMALETIQEMYLMLDFERASAGYNNALSKQLERQREPAP